MSRYEGSGDHQKTIDFAQCGVKNAYFAVSRYEGSGDHEKTSDFAQCGVTKTRACCSK